MQSFENGDLIALLGQIAGASQAGGTGANDGNSVAIALRTNRLFGAEGVVPVSNKALQTANANGFALDAANTLGLTLSLLGANTAANCGQRGGLIDDLVSALEVAFLDLADELRNMDLNGAAVNTRHSLAVQAAVGLVNGGLLGVAQSDLIKVMCTHQGILGGHYITGRSHICLCHFTVPPS